MQLRLRLLPLQALACVILLAACGNDAKKPETKSVDDWFPMKLGERTVRLQVALSPVEMQRGLMFRKTLGADEGMVFVFDRPQIMSFWMRNTELPLDIAYFDPNGELKEVYAAFPHDERPVKSYDRRQIVVEMNQGWFARAGLRAGSRVDVAALVEAMRARGYDPREYGLP